MSAGQSADVASAAGDWALAGQVHISMVGEGVGEELDVRRSVETHYGAERTESMGGRRGLGLWGLAFEHPVEVAPPVGQAMDQEHGPEGPGLGRGTAFGGSRRRHGRADSIAHVGGPCPCGG